jgi:lipoprotein-releasing system permease protein
MPPMFQPLSLFVGLRYVRARSQKFFVSFLTWIAALGVALGVMALIVVLSAMNGYEEDNRGRLLALTAHARVQPRAADFDPAAWPALLADLRAQPGVAAVAPYVQLEAVAVNGAESTPLLLLGIDPRAEASVSELARSLRSGSVDSIGSGDRLLLGALLADRLAVGPGDTIRILVPAVSATGVPEPRLRELEVAGIFEVGAQESDAVLAYTSLDAARDLAQGDARAEGLRLRFDDVLAAGIIADGLRSRLPATLELRDWTQDHAGYFRAIRIEKTMMSLILALIVGIAAFNLVSMLVMVVNDKRTDIAILRTLGAARCTVQRMFLVQGLVIGWAGVAVGVLLGVLVAQHATAIMARLERWFGFEFMDSSVFYVTELPSVLRWSQVLLVAMFAFALSLLAAWWPSCRAARVAPADALRYERL